MDLDTSLKLAALGYIGNYYNTLEIIKWFKKKYNVKCNNTLTPKGDVAAILSWKEEDVGVIAQVRVLSTKSYIPSSPEYIRKDMIKLILKLFISENGIIYGPSEKFLDNLKEWT